MNRFAEIVNAFSQRRLLVLGDTIADRFVYGEISRVSREAPVFILRHEQTETIPGGAANCAMNLASLGAKVSLVTVLGDDEAGQALLERLKTTGVNCESVVLSDRVQTVTKMRVLAGQLHSTRQQVIRIDYEDGPLTDEALHLAIVAQSRANAANSDAIIISDYNYGVASEKAVEAIRQATAKHST